MSGEARPGRAPSTAALVAAALAIVALAPAWAPQASARDLTGTVEPGSVDNELTLTVTNTGDRAPVSGLRATVAGRPVHLTNIRIAPDRVERLLPGASQQFTVRFDVRPGAPPGQREELLFRILAPRGATVDLPEPVATLEFAPPRVATVPPPRQPGASAPAASTPSQPASPARLRLLRIIPSSGTPPAAGLSAASTRQGGDRVETSLRFDPLPLEIVPGQPFEIGIEIKERHGYPDRWTCLDRALNRPDPPSVRVDVGGISALDLGGTRGEFVATGSGDFQLYCDEGSHDGRMLGARDKDGASRLRLRFMPEPPPAGARPGAVYYDVQLSSDGRAVPATRQGQSKRLFDGLTTSDPQGFVAPGVRVDPPSHMFGIRIAASGALAMSMVGVALHYGPVHAADPYVASVAPYSHPADIERPPRGTTAVAGGSSAGRAGAQGPPPGSGTAPRTGDPTAGVAPGASGSTTPGSSAGPSGASGSTPVVGTPGFRPGSAPGPVDPSRLDPRSPDVAPLIRQWMGVAEPPDNARGARLRYDEWGRMVGAGVNREQITAGARPDGAGGMASTEYVWTLRDRLDSVNHCTLGEYVVAMLESASIARCQGRHKAPPPRRVMNYAGLPAQEAESRVRALGLVPDLIGGDPAPSREQEYTVQSQDPQGGSQLREGERVTLTIHSGYAAPERPRAVAPQPLPGAGALPPLPRPAEPPSRAEPEICATYYSNLPDLGRGASTRMAQLAAQSAVAAGCDPQRVQQAVTGTLAPAQPGPAPAPSQAPPPPPPPAASAPPASQPAWPAPRPWPGQPQGAPPQQGGGGEPAACAQYYETLSELARADEGPNGTVAQMTARSAVAAGCSPQRVQQALARGAASPYSRQAPPPASLPGYTAPAPRATPPPAEPAVCNTHYSNLYTWSRRYPGGSTHQVVQNEARRALAAGCNRQRVEQILVQGRPPAPPRSQGPLDTRPPASQVPLPAPECPGGRIAILGQC